MKADPDEIYIPKVVHYKCHYCTTRSMPCKLTMHYQRVDGKTTKQEFMPKPTLCVATGLKCKWTKTEDGESK